MEKVVYGVTVLIYTVCNLELKKIKLNDLYVTGINQVQQIMQIVNREAEPVGNLGLYPIKAYH